MAIATREASRDDILIVEDDAGVRDSLADILREEGYGVATARNGREALRYLQAKLAPRLILLDLMMPIMDGQKFRSEQLRIPTLAFIPTILLSAARDAKQRAETLGVQEFLQKPIALDKLLDVVRRNV